MSQRTEILKYLRKGGKLTPYSALRLFGCLRLSERIREIRYDLAMSRGNLDIKKGWKKVGKKRVMEYWL